jgi:hypothetical protein
LKQSSRNKEVNEKKIKEKERNKQEAGDLDSQNANNCIFAKLEASVVKQTEKTTHRVH